jgi:hypothetical protein
MGIAALVISVVVVGGAACCWTGGFPEAAVSAIYLAAGWIIARRRTWLFDTNHTEPTARRRYGLPSWLSMPEHSLLRSRA